MFAFSCFFKLCTFPLFFIFINLAHKLWLLVPLFICFFWKVWAHDRHSKILLTLCNFLILLNFLDWGHRVSYCNIWLDCQTRFFLSTRLTKHYQDVAKKDEVHNPTYQANQKVLFVSFNILCREARETCLKLFLNFIRPQHLNEFQLGLPIVVDGKDQKHKHK